METKQCNRCNGIKSLSDFGIYRKAPDGKQRNCIICNRQQAREHYYKNKEKHCARAAARKSRIKSALINIKERLGCRFCGEKCNLCLDFHHFNKQEKDIEISSVFMGIERLSKEIKKCEIVCANCHRKLHGGLLTLESKREIDDSELRSLLVRKCYKLPKVRNLTMAKLGYLRATKLTKEQRREIAKKAAQARWNAKSK